MSERRRASDETPSGGMVTTATAAKILDLTPNGFRDVVARGLIEPAFTFRNGKEPLRVYWRHEVERLAEARRRYETGEVRLRQALGLAPEVQLPLLQRNAG